MITINELAELGFSFVDETIMSNGKYLIEVYSRPFKINGEFVHTIEELKEKMKLANISYQDKLSAKTKKKDEN